MDSFGRSKIKSRDGLRRSISSSDVETPDGLIKRPFSPDKGNLFRSRSSMDTLTHSPNQLSPHSVGSVVMRTSKSGDLPQRHMLTPSSAARSMFTRGNQMSRSSSSGDKISRMERHRARSAKAPRRGGSRFNRSSSSGDKISRMDHQDRKRARSSKAPHRRVDKSFGRTSSSGDRISKMEQQEKRLRLSRGSEIRPRRRSDVGTTSPYRPRVSPRSGDMKRSYSGSGMKKSKSGTGIKRSRSGRSSLRSSGGKMKRDYSGERNLNNDSGGTGRSSHRSSSGGKMRRVFSGDRFLNNNEPHASSAPSTFLNLSASVKGERPTIPERGRSESAKSVSSPMSPMSPRSYELRKTPRSPRRDVPDHLVDMERIIERNIVLEEDTEESGEEEYDDGPIMGEEREKYLIGIETPSEDGSDPGSLTGPRERRLSDESNAESDTESVQDGVVFGGADEHSHLSYVEKTNNWCPKIKVLVKKAWSHVSFKFLSPNRWFIQVWTAIMTICLIFYSIIITCRAFFFYDSLWWLFVDYIVTILYFLDFVVQSFRFRDGKKSEEKGMEDEYDEGCLESCWKAIRVCNACSKDTWKNFSRYFISRWALVDVMTIFPFEWIGLAAFIEYYPFFFLNRLLKMFRFFEYIEIIQNALSSYIPPAYFRLLRSFMITMMSSHFMGCGFFFVIYIQGDKTSGDFVFPGEDILEMEWWRQYIRSYFWAFMTMTGYINTQPITDLETACSLVVSALGILLYITIIGTVGSLVSNLDQLGREFQKRMDEVNAFLNFRNLPSGLRDQIVDYYKYLWESRKSFEETKILEELPLNLKIAVAREVNKDVIQSVSFLADSPDDFIDYIALYLKPRIALPNVYIIQEGDIGNEMYFIEKGKVCVEASNGFKKVLGKGDFFGELSLLYNMKRNASIKTLTYCDFYIILKKHFDRIMKRKEFRNERMRIMNFTSDRYDGPPQIQVIPITPTDEHDMYESI